MFAPLFLALDQTGPTERVLALVVSVLAVALLTYGGVLLVHRLGRVRRWLPKGFRFVRRVAPPLCLLMATLTARVLLVELGLSVDGGLTLLDALAIALGAWIVMTLVSGVRWWLNAEFDIRRADNLRERRIHTQLGFIEKIVDVAIILGAVAAMLHQAPWGRTLGTSLIASAGVVSVIIGFAAQRTIANLIAGFQIAFTQPMRIDDAVVVEEEWGWIEEITLTYVVVRIWDQRRLVLPITYFIEKPFQNWTRTSGQILGSVHLTVSHEASFDRIEERFNALLDDNELWDRDARVLQVVESNERSVTLRALMTAKDSPSCWDLRCDVRRGLLEFIAQEHPDALPSIRLRSVPGSETSRSERAVA